MKKQSRAALIDRILKKHGQRAEAAEARVRALEAERDALKGRVADLQERLQEGPQPVTTSTELYLGAAAPDAGLEVCIYAAVRLPDGRVIRGHRHGDAMQAAAQGFVTSRGRFVGREEGRQLQDAASIPSAAMTGYRGDFLFSEYLIAALRVPSREGE